MEDLAVAFRGVAEAAGGHPGGAVEGADEVREVSEADVEGDVGHSSAVVGEQARGVTQARTHQVLVRGDAEHVREQAQEMERTEARFRGGIVEDDGLVRMGVNPERGFDRTAAIACRRVLRPARAPGLGVDEAAGEQQSDLVDANRVRPVAAACASSQAPSYRRAVAGTPPATRSVGPPIVSTSAGSK